MGILKAQIHEVAAENMAVRAQLRVQSFKDVEAEILKKCLGIQEQIEQVRTDLKGYITSPENPHGCLRGDVDDYLEKFDSQIARLKD